MRMKRKSESAALSGELGQLFLTHGPAVYRRALRLLCNHQDAEEATQEVFIRVLRGADGFAGQSQISTWLYRITTNYCLNQIRDRRRRRELFAEHAVDAHGPDPASPSDVALLRRLLAEADEEQARVAIYIYMDGMTHEEVAEVLSVSRRTVGNQLARFHSWAERRLGGQAAIPHSGRSEP